MVAISRTAKTISLYQSRHSRSSVSILCRVGYNSSAPMLQHPRSGFGTASKEHSGEMMMKAPRFIELRPIFRRPLRTSSKACTQRATIPIFVRLSTLLYYDCLKPIEIDAATASYAVPEQSARRPLCTTKTSGVGDHSLWRRLAFSTRVRNDPTKQCDQNWNRHVDCGSTCGGRRPKSNTSRPET
jgi:hypothetical protein